ncbi:hypothetical protein Plhal304r1_c017g0062601 [Plasmopara halstedii]
MRADENFEPSLVATRSVWDTMPVPLHVRVIHRRSGYYSYCADHSLRQSIPLRRIRSTCLMHGGTKSIEIRIGVLTTLIATNTLYPVASFVLCEGLELAKASKTCALEESRYTYTYLL